tara:strand:+ start:76 stop:963 length:888 start_codon:yes stop_codon:yes gene_type:complete
MSAEKRKNDSKKAEVKSIKLDQIKSLSSIDIDLKNLQKLADKFDKKGLSAYVPLSNKLLTIYDEMKVVASKSQLDVNEFFVLSKMKKVLFGRVNYPSEKTPDGKFVRSPSFESAVNRAVQLSLLRINNVAGITIKELEVLVISKLVYPTLQTINDEGEKEYIANDSNKLVKLTTRKLSELYKSLLPDNAFRKGTQSKDDTITKTLIEMKKVLESEVKKRVSNPDYIMENYGKTDFETLNQIAKISLRLSEQYVRDNRNDTKDGKTKDVEMIAVQSVSYDYKNNKGQVLGSSKLAG